MLETVTLLLVAMASKFVIISNAFQSIAGSFTIIVASIGAISLSISGALAWLATLLPPPQKLGKYSIFYKYVNILGGNIGNAANKITEKQ